MKTHLEIPIEITPHYCPTVDNLPPELSHLTGTVDVPWIAGQAPGWDAQPDSTPRMYWVGTSDSSDIDYAICYTQDNGRIYCFCGGMEMIITDDTQFAKVVYPGDQCPAVLVAHALPDKLHREIVDELKEGK